MTVLDSSYSVSSAFHIPPNSDKILHCVCMNGLIVVCNKPYFRSEAGSVQSGCPAGSFIILNGNSDARPRAPDLYRGRMIS